MVTLAQVAAALGRPVERLQELDRRPLLLAFLGGTYETVVVRDRNTGETLEATLDVDSGDGVDAAELRRRNREVGELEGEALDPALRDLLLRHPELPAIRVVVTRETARDKTAFQASAIDVAALARDRDVIRIELADDVEVLD